MENIYLIGFMGSGKSTIGKALAIKLNRDFLDTDELIVKKEGQTISEIFEKHGQDYFRTLETQALSEAAEMNFKIIATGGGIVIKPENIEVMKKTGKAVLLESSAQTTFARLKNDSSRPLLKNKIDVEYITVMKKEREAFYNVAKDIMVNTNNKNTEEIVMEIIRLLG